MEDMWKGVAIFGIWGGVAICSFTITPVPMGVLAVAAAIATAIVAEN